MKIFKWLVLGQLWVIFLFAQTSLFAQAAREVGVEISATKTSGNKIELHWKSDTGVLRYIVYKRIHADSNWLMLDSFNNSVLSYVDTVTKLGKSMEYRVAKRKNNYTFLGNGYLRGGFEIPVQPDKGIVLLLLDSNLVVPVKSEISDYIEQLTSEGFEVVKKSVLRTESVSTIKAWIFNQWKLDSSRVKCVLILGRVPVPYSGDINPDGHADHRGAWPADNFYGCFYQNYTDATVNRSTASRAATRNVPGDGKFDLSRINPVGTTWANTRRYQLPVGRVDLFDMPAFGSDTILLKRYLRKNLAFRQGLVEFPAKALVDDNFGYFVGEAFASGGYRNFSTYVGDSIVDGDYTGTGLGMKSTKYLWSYGCGGGSYTSCSGVSNSSAMTTDSLLNPFTMIFGSYFGDWDNTNNFLRSPLASKGWGLASVWSGRPYWVMHESALGAPLYESVKSTYNCTNIYAVAAFGSGHVHVALMGDPTLRIFPIANIRGLSTTDDCAGNVTFRWKRPTQQTDSTWIDVWKSGAWVNIGRIVGSDTVFQKNFTTGDYKISIRSKKLMHSASGTWWDLGAREQVEISVKPIPKISKITPNADKNIIQWYVTNVSCITGFELYRSTDSFSKSSEIIASGISAVDTTYIDTNAITGNKYFYRLKSVFAFGQKSDYSDIVSVLTGLTYVWNKTSDKTGTRSWFTANNWTPARSLHSKGDILQFPSGDYVVSFDQSSDQCNSMQIQTNATVKLKFGQNATLNFYAHNVDTARTSPGFNIIENNGVLTLTENKVVAFIAKRSKHRLLLGGELVNQLDSLELSVTDSVTLAGNLVNEKSIKLKNTGDFIMLNESAIHSAENGRIYLFSAGNRLKTAMTSHLKLSNVVLSSFLGMGSILHNSLNRLTLECNNASKSQYLSADFNGQNTKLILNKSDGVVVLQSSDVELGTLSLRKGDYNLNGYRLIVNDSMRFQSSTNYLVAGDLYSNRGSSLILKPLSLRILNLQFKPDYAVLKNVQLIGKDTAFLTVNLVSAMNIKGGEDGGSGPGLLAINKNAKLVIPTGGSLTLESDTFNAALSLSQPAQRSIVCTGTGKFNIERDHYGVRGWRLYSHPFKSDIDLQEVANDIELIGSGGTAEGFYSDNYKNGAAYGYDYSKADSTASTDPAWTAFTSAKGNTISGNANKWNKNSTLLLFNPGNRRGTDAFGSPSTATYEQGKITLSYTLDSTAVHLNDGITQTINTGVLPSKSKYFFITNPFTAPVKLCMIQGLNSSNVDPYFYYWKQRRNTVVDNFSPAEWQAEKIVVGNNSRDSNISIPAFGTILVRMKNSSSTIFTIPESAKQLSNYNYIIGGAKGVSKTGLMFADATGSGIGQNGVEIKLLVNDSQEADRVLIYNEPNQSPAYTTYDAVKYLNQDFPNIYTLSADAKPLAIDMQDIKAQLDAGQPEVRIPLGVNRESDKRFSSLKWELSENTTGMDLYLKDLQSQQVEAWSTGVAKNIALDVQSLTTKRYTLVFRLRASAVKDPINETAKNNGSKSLVMLAYPNPTDGKIALKLSNGESYQGEYELFDLVGRLVQKGNSNDKKQLDLSALVDGQYLLKSKNYAVIIFKN